MRWWCSAVLRQRSVSAIPASFLWLVARAVRSASRLADSASVACCDLLSPAASAAAAPDCATCLRAVTTPAFSASLLIPLASLFPTARGPFVASHVHVSPRRRSSCSLSCQPPALPSVSSSLSRTSFSCRLMAAEACTGRGSHVSAPPSQRIRYSLPPLSSSRDASTAVMVGSAGRAIAGPR